jgi:hypothetical protein
MASIMAYMGYSKTLDRLIIVFRGTVDVKLKTGSRTSPFIRFNTRDAKTARSMRDSIYLTWPYPSRYTKVLNLCRQLTRESRLL